MWASWTAADGWTLWGGRLGTRLSISVRLGCEMRMQRLVEVDRGGGRRDGDVVMADRV